MQTLFSLLAVPVLALELGARAVQEPVRAISQAFGPRVTVHVSRPTFIWQIWSRTSTVTHVEMLLDSQPVGAKYDEEQRSVIYTPDQALSSGPHQVECRAIFDGTATFVKRWETTVAPDATATLPAPTVSQKRMLSAVNAKRHDLGLPDLVIDDRLDAAASAHVAYMCKNNEAGHDESPNNPGFVGQTGGIRCESFGWCTGSWEGVSVGEPSMDLAIANLYDAPYHRIPFMEAGTAAFGAGFNDARTTILFGMARTQSVTVSPADGQKEIPTIWVNHEEPSPLRGHTTKNFCGYPLVLAGFGPTIGILQVSSASLQSADGKSVEIWLLTAADDQFLKNAAIIIPLQPLQPGTTYTASAQIIYDDLNTTKTWKFTTKS